MFDTCWFLFSFGILIFQWRQMEYNGASFKFFFDCFDLIQTFSFCSQIIDIYVILNNLNDFCISWLVISKCFYKVPSRMKGECVRLKTKLVNWIISIFFGSGLSIQWNRKKWLLIFLNWVWRKAFLISQ